MAVFAARRIENGLAMGSGHMVGSGRWGGDGWRGGDRCWGRAGGGEGTGGGARQRLAAPGVPRSSGQEGRPLPPRTRLP